jgi:biopolymer transport protein ExbB
MRNPVPILLSFGLSSWTVLAEAKVEVAPSVANGKITQETLFDTFAAGGPVMWPILLCSLIGLAYGLERLLNLRHAQILPPALLNDYRTTLAGLKDGSLTPEKAFKTLQPEGNTEGARLFKRFMKREFSNIRDLEQVLQEYIEVTQWTLQRNLKPLAFVVQISPLLGLFGTVLGMIEAFNVVAEQGLGKPELLASGMAVALLTTGFGLGVAIPCSLFHHFLLERSNRITLKMYNMLHELAMELCPSSSKPK